MESYDVLVVGGGIVGCSVAYHVSRAGLRVALFEKGALAQEATLAGAGMLAPLAEMDELDVGGLDADELDAGGLDVDELDVGGLDVGERGKRAAFTQLCLAGLRYYQGLDERLREETGVDIELVKLPTLRLAFSEVEAEQLRMAYMHQRALLKGMILLEGKGVTLLEGEAIHREEGGLPDEVVAALLSPMEWNVQGYRVALAFARGAMNAGAHIYEGQPVRSLLREKERVIGLRTAQGDWRAEHVVLATGAWHDLVSLGTSMPAVFPVKGQMLALQPPMGTRLHHTLYYHRLGYLVPKADGSIYVGATSEQVGFDTSVTAEGIASLLNTATGLIPTLKHGRFIRAWAGLRPASQDGLPLLGVSERMPGVYWASGHFRNGILLGPLTGHIVAELICKRATPSECNLIPFAPDRFAHATNT